MFSAALFTIAKKVETTPVSVSRRTEEQSVVSPARGVWCQRERGYNGNLTNVLSERTTSQKTTSFAILFIRILRKGKSRGLKSRFNGDVNGNQD